MGEHRPGGAELQVLSPGHGQAVRASYGGSAPDGGFLLMPQHETGPLEKLLAERVDMRNHCSVVSISAYTYKEQVQTSDIVFLQKLCKAAGLALKVTALLTETLAKVVPEVIVGALPAPAGWEFAIPMQRL